MAQYDGTSAERRRSVRIVTVNQALAFNGMQYGRIVDIGLTGLCFEYTAGPKDEPAGNILQDHTLRRLDLVCNSNDFTLIDLPVRVVADFAVDTPRAGANAVHCRHRVLVFDDIGPAKLRALRLFLRINRVAQGAIQWPVSPGGASPRNEGRLLP